MSKGKLFVVSGPSGAGKGTICKKILAENENMRLSVSMTTRQPRAGETDKVDYHFVSKDEFKKLLAQDGLLEYNEYVNNFYGTPRKDVVKWLEEGFDVMLEIDYNGAFQVKKTYPEAVLIFVLPPCVEDLRGRILGRGAEDEAVLKKRMEVALEEINQAEKYDYKIVNDDLENAVGEFRRIMKIEKEN